MMLRISLVLTSNGTICIIVGMQSVEIELGETVLPKCKKKKQNVRDTFPKVYKFEDSRTGKPYWLVDARSKRWGMNDRIQTR